ncbi:ethylbenzene dehydrogenase-related protein [Inmirania thermothiophila]|uniref:DMSO reductase family type II enzyme heme b subunit n=1 Tax=Inmirania thermothiophila TaxID=1750597 RepID=A0A3N1Y0R9_9GAMM|nr:ethylbenzene dehydrogenase-related protein [Inmirania thermothiophila]ROR32416.1 DMSO reductase family type II enzyme heme b subunit [Inmirania thermothiophila]
MCRKLLLTGIAALAVAAPAAAQGPDGAVVVGRTARDLTTDPDAAVWRNAPETVVALVPQTIAIPNGGGSVSRIRIQGLHNGRRIAFRLSWDDATADTENAVETFRDAVALLFPLDARDPTKTSPLMGNKGAPVNIWQWRADWQADRDGADRLAARQPHTAGFWISPVDEILKARYPGKPRPDAVALEFVAEGWGTLTRQAQQDVDAGGRWRDGRWSVVFVRDLERTDGSDAAFAPGARTVLNVAVWNGHEEDVNGRKSVSLQWIPVEVR